MSITTRLTIAGYTFDVLRCRYSFRRTVDAKGWPRTGMYGGEILVELESSDDTLLLEYFLTKEPKPIQGSLEVWDDTEQTPIRTLEWSKAYIYAIGEAMQRHAALPMTLTLAITPLRLDINRTLRIDRRWPQTYGFRWEEYEPEEEPLPAAGAQAEEAEEPECTLLFRRRKLRAEHFAFDWVRTGDTQSDTPGDHWYSDIMPIRGQYDRLTHGEYRFFDQEWKQQYEQHKPTSRYVIPWLTLMKGRAAKLRLKLEVNRPPGSVELRLTGGGSNSLSLSPTRLTADREGAYFHTEELTISCTGTFSAETFVEAYAGNRLVGKLAVIPNANQYPITVALIPVKITDKDVKKPKSITTKILKEEVKKKISLLTDQSYIQPSYFEHGITLDLTEPYTFSNAEKPLFDAYFRNNPDKIVMAGSTRRTSNRLPNGLGGLDIHQFLDKMLYDQHKELADQFRQTYRLYFISFEADCKGVACDIGVHNGSAIVFEPDGYTIPHELFHVLGLEHSFLPNNPLNQKDGTHYYYDQHFTDNLMDYVSPNTNHDNRASLWYWQIKQLWRNLKKWKTT